MSTKKYILTHIVFAVLLALCPTLFFMGYYFKELNIFWFYVLLLLSFVFLSSAIIFLVLNRKNMTLYEKNKILNKIKDLDFKVLNSTLSESECINKLIMNGYRNLENNILHKEIEENCGDSYVILNYYAKLIRVDNTVNIQQCLEGFTKGFTNYNIGYIFINENLEHNLNLLKVYIKDTIVDVEVHRYKYKNFFVPIIISENKIYYLKGGSFISEYKTALKAGTQIFSSDF